MAYRVSLFVDFPQSADRLEAAKLASRLEKTVNYYISQEYSESRAPSISVKIDEVIPKDRRPHVDSDGSKKDDRPKRQGGSPQS